MIATKNTSASSDRYSYDYYSYSGVVFGSDTYAKKMAEKKTASGTSSLVSGQSPSGIYPATYQMYGINNAGQLPYDMQNYLGNIKSYSTNLKAALASLVAKGANSASKTISLDSETSVASKKASGETVSSEKDVNGIVSETKKMAEAYNSLLKTAYDNAKNKGALKLYEQLGSLALSYGSSLAKIGINFNAGGSMAIDESKLTESAQNGALESFLNPETSGNTNYGFGYRLNKIATEASDNPLSYYKGIGEAQRLASSAGTSQSVSANGYNYNYLSSLNNYEAIYMKNFTFFNKYFNIGLMFDSMF